MNKKVIISENQLLIIKNHIFEVDAHETLVKRIVADLDLNYEPHNGVYKKGGEFHEESMILNKVSQELLTPKSLGEYLDYKYKLSFDFIKQIIKDWYTGSLDNDKNLSKNITI